ncbi:MAG: tetratricopeptide repeat protein [Christensenellales bacterium]
MSLPIQRILTKLDDYLSKNDYEGAEKHLLYWVQEAKDGEMDVLCLHNELIGLYRKTGKKQQALEQVDIALNMVEQYGKEQMIDGATTYVNAATAYKAFGMAELSIPLFEKARIIYEKNLPSTDSRIAGLYNNTALALVDLKEFDQAKKLYEKAIDILNDAPRGALEQAISYLNLATMHEVQYGLSQGEEYINECLEKASQLLDKHKDDTDGYYAFVCEKCATVFGYYGWVIYEKQLIKRYTAIYERD